jgi:hypothetical protein
VKANAGRLGFLARNYSRSIEVHSLTTFETLNEEDGRKAGPRDLVGDIPLIVPDADRATLSAKSA